MKRLTQSIVACLLLSGLAAQPASAERTHDAGAFPHLATYFFGAGDYGQSEIVQVPTGEWIRLATGWATATGEQLDQFLETVIVEVERDGVPQTVSPIIDRDPAGPSVLFSSLLNPGAANVPQHWTLRLTFTQDHADGHGEVIPAGTVMEQTRTIVRTPRGRFPSAAYPCPNGSNPCVDF